MTVSRRILRSKRILRSPMPNEHPEVTMIS